MYTMLYDAETLKPQLLINEDIKNGDIGKPFSVINGAWDGTFNGDSISIHHIGYRDYIPNTVYKCYKFTSSPHKDYYDLYESCYPEWISNGIPYQPWFAHFEDLVVKGEIE